MKILVSGAGVAGLSLGRDLGMRGHHVVLVERADRLRGNGSPIDVRGDAIEVAGKMGILPAVRDARIRMTEQVHFVDEHGTAVGRLPADIGDSPDDIEIASEDLSRILADAGVRIGSGSDLLGSPSATPRSWASTPISVPSHREARGSHRRGRQPLRRSGGKPTGPERVDATLMYMQH